MSPSVPSDDSTRGMRPCIGDLIVQRHRNHVGYVITLVGASASRETYCDSRECAITLATRAARPLRATVWETSDGTTFDLVPNYGTLR